MSRGPTASAIVPFPPLQHLMTDWLALEQRRHTMHDLLEVDVTDTRRAIREYHARTGAPLSLTAFMTHCLARAVDEVEPPSVAMAATVALDMLTSDLRVARRFMSSYPPDRSRSWRP